MEFHRLTRISPTALSWFEKDPDKFVMYYVLGEKRMGQTKAMAMGSAFDARVKGELEHDLLGVKNRWEDLFQKQVDASLQEYTEERSLDVLDAYKRTGAYGTLLRILEGHVSEPRFEFDAAGIVRINDLDVPFYGKPDGFTELVDCLLCLDWKLNGFESQASPAAGYVSLRSEDGRDAGPHKNTFAIRKHGFKVAVGASLPKDWQTQLAMYQLMIEPDNKKPWVAQIEQLAYAKGILRVATHCLSINPDFIEQIKQRVYKCWSAVVNDHYYPNLSKEESQARVQYLRDMDDDTAWVVAGAR